MNKREWQIFWKLKLKEIGIAFLCIIGFIFIPFPIGKLLSIYIDPNGCKDSILKWCYGFVAILILTLIVLCSWVWIDNNIKKAKEIYKKEQKKKK